MEGRGRDIISVDKHVFSTLMMAGANLPLLPETLSDVVAAELPSGDLDRNFFGTTAGVQPEWDAPDELRIAEAADADAIANADVNDEAGTTKRKADGGNEAGAGATRPKRRRK